MKQEIIFILKKKSMNVLGSSFEIFEDFEMKRINIIRSNIRYF